MEPHLASKPSALARLSGWTQRRPLIALLLWVLVFAAAIGASGAVGSAFEDDNSMPGTESQELSDLLDERAPEANELTVQVVFGAEDVAAEQDRIAAFLADLGDEPGVTGVNDPFAEYGAVSEDGTVGYATLTWDGTTAEAADLIPKAEEASSDGLEFALGGDVIREAGEGGGGAAEGIGMLAALVILVFMFGSLLAASLPLITALFAVGTAFCLSMLVSHAVTLPTFLTPIMFLVGFGVGVDYALLIFARFRAEIQHGASRRAAAAIALDTAGRSVLFAGSVVIVALMGLFALGLGSLQAVAIAVALTVLVTMLASVTLLPALLALFGKRIEKSVRKKAARAKRAPGSRWVGWSRFVEKQAWLAIIVVTAGLVALATPLLDLRLGFADAGTDTEGTTSREAYDLLSDGFGEGFNGPLMVVTDGTEAEANAAFAAMNGLDTVAMASPPFAIGDDLWMSTVVGTAGPADQATVDLVHELRDDVLNEVEGTQLVGGSTAAAIDFSDIMIEKAPLFLLFVVGLSLLLLMVVFRSVLIPIKAAILNLMTIGASLGVVAWIFQEGMFGIPAGPVEAFVPVMSFAIIFGLSMDYEVFLMSRMREEWQRTGDPVEAVRRGLASTGGVVTAAAAIMMAVFGSFVLDDARLLQQFGISMAVAIFIDAFVIRCLLVPAIMKVMGRGAWWMPKWLDKAMPHVTVEPETEARPLEREPVPAR
ncbi:MMPL family transporter [Glycomyces algeriensis]|uniref:Membrane protein n=1 Tax=Glycomyces algeriensis TaxID=256037 RepID=A0A9W6G7J6_9ACTN|nr:MMPL family transporter [Glycomyces algeriensis]MDA1365000.1 MMPL family transporter [Glycomyces algeriensis]MDR7349939.1 RND superfamily putative drug exporter [Glycomyces algeriensis]GLI42649.1 membrane protein [Glycomyces algeriensis]